METDRLFSYPARQMKRLYFDIETSPNIATVWRAGRKQWVDYENILQERAVICIGFKLEGDKSADILTWDKNQCDRKMLAKFGKLLSGVTECVGHNIDRFDMPWVRSRMLFHGLPPMPRITTSDTLQWARRYMYFNSNRLDYIATFLGIGCKVHTEFKLWKDILIHNDARALQTMSDYCKHDVELLEKVFTKLQPWSPAKTHAGVMNNGEKWTCPRCASESVIRWSRWATAAGTIRNRMRCKDCLGSYTISDATVKQYEGRPVAA
jgi:hypothetical protein